MEQSQKQKRREAEQEFQASLEHLEDILQETLTEDKETADTATDDDSETVDDEADINLAALEDAVADIELYLEQRRKPK